MEREDMIKTVPAEVFFDPWPLFLAGKNNLDTSFYMSFSYGFNTYNSI